MSLLASSPILLVSMANLLNLPADIFLSVTDGKTPEERMTRVLRWYLSSFHAGRQSSVAKKPYNPILGETFRCHWKLDDEDEALPYKDGILPWCSRSDLTFVAEQVCE